MRYCIPIPCFYASLTFSEAMRRIASHGFDAAETYDWKMLDPGEVKNACRETGVSLISMCTTCFDLTSPERRKAWLDGLRESLDAAEKFGVTHLITQVGNDTGKERAYQHESVVAGLREARSLLEDYGGVTLMIEPLNPIVDHKGTFLTTAAEGFSIVREVGHPLVKLVYDIYHQQITEGNLIPSITQNMDCIAHFHAAGHPGRVELQFGETDYRNVFAAIEKTGYDGACGLEYCPTMPPDESLESFRRFYL